MNPISSAAWDSLERDCLPKLLEFLKENSAIKPEALIQTEFHGLVEEVSELIKIISSEDSCFSESNNPTGPEVIEPESGSSDMSDEDALALLAEMEGEALPSAKPNQEAMSDEDAMMLLAEMEGEVDEPEMVSTASADDPSSAEDEALAMLAGMEEDSSSASELGEDIKIPPYEEVAEITSNEFSSDPEMLEDFVVNSRELKESLDQLVLKLESAPTDTEIIEEIFRAAHTLKGVAGMMGFRGIENLMHWMESYFDLLRKGKKQANSHAIDVLFQGIDLLETLMTSAATGSPSGIKLAPIIQKLRGLEFDIQPESTNKTSKPTDEKGERSADEIANTATPAKQPEKENSTIRVDLARLDSLVNLVGELVIDRTRFASIEEELRVKAGDLPLVSHMTETVQLFGRHMNDIQETIMKIRMVPIGNAFSRYNRVVRDLSRTMEKEIDLVIDGQDTELDKTLVEMIGDPLVHLIRNACDHGIESPEIRQMAGKKSRGMIHLSARQEGNNIVIMIEDDGKGLDLDGIREKAIDRGLMEEDTVMTNRELFSLIFEAGFSTAKEVTNISGRGVGMDVVKKQISSLKGLIDIDSAKGKGTKITIQLPLTLAIVQSLLVRTGQEIFAVPLSSVIESLRISPRDIQKVGDTEVINRRDMMLPLVYLDQILHLEKKEKEFWYDRRDGKVERLLDAQRESRREERVFVVVVGSAERRFGIIVDSLLHQQEVVIKSMGPLLHDTQSISGGAILGDGEVVLVLDMAELESIVRSKSRSLAA